MTFEQAVKEGWLFTGRTWGRYEEHESDYKAEAARIKKVFKGADYRIVTGSRGSWLSPGCKAIMGNEIFRKFHLFNFDNTFSAIEKFHEQVERIQKRYQEELEHATKTQKQRIDLYNEACRLSGKRLQIDEEAYLK